MRVCACVCACVRVCACASMRRYSHIWDIEGAVESSVGAKRVLYESLRATMEQTAKFINCEDGLEIPW